MAVHLDLADIQGNILSAYGKLGFPKGRFITLHVDDAAPADASSSTPCCPRSRPRCDGRRIGREFRPAPCAVPRPQVAVNIAFSWYGLVALGISDPHAARHAGRVHRRDDGARADARRRLHRAAIGRSHGTRCGLRRTTARMVRSEYRAHAHHLERADETRRQPGRGARRQDPRDRGALPSRSAGCGFCRATIAPGAAVRPGTRSCPRSSYRKPDGTVSPSPKEHFGFTDAHRRSGLRRRQYPDDFEKVYAEGNGAVDGAGKWRPLATGEFLLGYPDEAQEIAGAAMPLNFSRNGTFMAYRKLHQNVVAFHTFMTETAARFGAVSASAIPRTRRRPSRRRSRAVGRTAFRSRARRLPPIGKHSMCNFRTFRPRQNPAGYQARDRALIQLHLRADDRPRAQVPDHLPYAAGQYPRRPGADRHRGFGAQQSPAYSQARAALRRLDGGGARLGRARHHHAGRVREPVSAVRVRAAAMDQLRPRRQCRQRYLSARRQPFGGRCPKAKFVIPSDPKSGRPPFVVEGIPQFVETRGGEYFFVPSMTALRMIGMGVVDPT